MSKINSFYCGDFTIKTVTLHKCPLCGSLHNSAKAVQKHYADEVAWQKMHKLTVKGSKIKLFRFGKVSEIVTVTSVKYFSKKNGCGQLLNIFIESSGRFALNQFTSQYLDSFKPASEEEVQQFVRQKNKKEAKSLRKKLKLLESQSR